MADNDLLTPGVEDTQTQAVTDNQTLLGTDAQPTGPASGDRPDASPAWAAQLPADLKSNEVLTKFKTLGDLGKAYIEANRKLGKSLTLPAEGDAEGWAKVFTRLGRPDSPDGYQLNDAILLSNGDRVLDEATEKEFRQKAHAAGLSNVQAKALYDWIGTRTAGQVKQVQEIQKTAKAQAEKELQEEWGADYKANMSFAIKGVNAFAKSRPEFVSFLQKTGMGNHPEMARLFRFIGEAISEDTVSVGTTPETSGNDNGIDIG